MIIRASTAAFECCGVRIDAIPLADAVDELCHSAEAGPRTIHLCNAYSLAVAARDPSFAALLNRGDLNFPDGMPLVWIARALGFSNMTRRVYGPDLMAATLDRGRTSGVRHFLLGATPGVLDALRTRIDSEWPGAVVAGSHAPPFRSLGEDDELTMMHAVRAANAAIVWVGLGTPKQDLFVDRYRNEIPSTLVAVGAAFDFIAGNKRQSPEWLRDHGLEWAFRLFTEPRRLGRRYVFGNARFVACVLSSRGRPRRIREESAQK